MTNALTQYERVVVDAAMRWADNPECDLQLLTACNELSRIRRMFEQEYLQLEMTITSSSIMAATTTTTTTTTTTETQSWYQAMHHYHCNRCIKLLPFITYDTKTNYKLMHEYDYHMQEMCRYRKEVLEYE